MKRTYELVLRLADDYGREQGISIDTRKVFEFDAEDYGLAELGKTRDILMAAIHDIEGSIGIWQTLQNITGAGDEAEV